MIIKRNLLPLVLLLTSLVIASLPVAEATAVSFTVRGGEVETKPLSLKVEDRVTIKFVVTGEKENVLDFYITDPHGITMQAFGTTGNVNHFFVCSEEGEYNMHFSNIAWTDDKLVALDYEIQHYIFGMPQMLFMTLIIVGICVAMVAVFVLLGKTR